MSAVLVEPVPLVKDETGSIRVTGSRITLDTVIGFYSLGHSAEELVRAFPTLALADVHQILAYYLRHQEEVTTYLTKRAAEAEKLRVEIEARWPSAGLKERLLARKANRP